MTTTPSNSEHSNSSVAITPVENAPKSPRLKAKRAPARQGNQSEATIADVEVFEPEPEAPQAPSARTQPERKKPSVRKPQKKKPAQPAEPVAEVEPQSASSQPKDRRSRRRPSSKLPQAKTKSRPKAATADEEVVATVGEATPKKATAKPKQRKAESKKSEPKKKKSSKAVATIAPVATVAPTAATAAPTKPAGKPVSSRPIPVSQTQAQKQQAADVPEEGEEDTQFLLTNAVPSWMVSMVVHAIVLLVLAMLFIPVPEDDDWAMTMGQVSDREKPEELQIPIPENIEEELTEVEMDEFVPQKIDQTEPDVVSQVEFEDSLDSPPPLPVGIKEFADKNAPRNNLLNQVNVVTGNGLNQRSGAKRAAMIAAAGGTKESEAAVALALEWLAQHQARDGSWCFNHNAGPCNGRCGNPGNIGPESRIGSTAMALLPFLGAGQTHKEGKYKANVEAGLYFLTRAMKVARGMGDMTDSGGRMYSHGLAAIALTEAYGMTKDRSLMGPAQMSVNFIVYAQDPVGGGWRYRPHQPGDTSVVGWQIMALKSAHLAYLRVPPETIRKASKFLDSVQVDYGSQYGYTAPGPRPSTTAVGLLCRMLLGWKKENASLQRGVEILGNIGPSQDMYFNYYATQVLRHYGGKEWTKWNEQMRDMLVETQDKRGHQRGSWYIGRDHGTGRGGRLYTTCMATMILEVYYRHMPIYGRQASDEEFPL